MSQDHAPHTAFDLAAPADERQDALGQVQRAHMPNASDLIPRGQVAEVIDYIQDQYAEQSSLRKAQVIPFPGRDRAKSGMQSVRLDRLQVMAYGDYFERPSSIGFEALRHMVEQTPVLNAVIMTRIRQVQRFCNVQEGGSGPGFQIAHVDPEHEMRDDEQRSRQLLARFLTNCGWEFNPRRRKALHRDNFSTFMAKLVRESLTYDAAAIETEQRDDGKGIAGLYALDGSTIRLCSEEGYHGDDSIFAVQVATGQVVTAYTMDDLIYEPRNPPADVRLAGYGLGETELLIRVVTGFLNAMTHNTKGFDDNSIPRGILHLTGEYSESDLAAFRRYWKAMVSGVQNTWSLPVLTARTPDAKATFERLGVDYDEMHFSKWMTFLVSIICAVYGMSPAEINFDSFTAGNTSALAGNDTAEKLAASKDSGLRPLMSYFESVLSDYVIGGFSEKYCFRWSGLDEEDQGRKDRLREQVLTVNEMRAQEGYDAMDGPLGDAPINPSLIGPWMQLSQQGAATDEGADDQQGDDGDTRQAKAEQGDADGGDDGEAPRRPQERDQGAAQARKADETAKGEGGGEWDRLAKANEIESPAKALAADLSSNLATVWRIDA